uniref:Uncharacterized protein n=1 Tax=Kalanchoe fedtschenkoi TaxID=63787 RepID=A0A7N0T1V2_KALFE
MCRKGDEIPISVPVTGYIESDGETTFDDGGLGDIWKELGLALAYCKETAEFQFQDSEHNSSDEESSNECEHSLILRDDIGYVCRICGIVQKNIEDVFEFQYKTRRSTRTYKYEPRSKGINVPLDFNFDGTELAGDKAMTGFSAHPRHAKQMRKHQVEGFNFLARNLVSDTPSGCILAHAPGSGKTFMVISFIQSFMARYPDARPLIVLPKGILATWKAEFTKWQVEEMPLYDLYSAVAESRSQQLEVLRKWIKERSILFLGYKQFSSIVSGGGNSEAASLCEDIMCRAPSILILDEGHTPRNKDTEVVNSISRVRTHRKVVLSGTLYQNHVQEVFNILELVHPKFLQLDASRLIVKRILSRVNMGGVKKIARGSGSTFYDLVEGALQSDDLKLKVHVINDLREMTKDILHYYKGDFLDDLPGLEDFTVMLNLKEWQKKEAKKLKRIGSVFKRNSVGSAIYLHAGLKEYSENVEGNGEKQIALNDETIDELIKQVDKREGVKAKFFLNALRLCEVTGEKLLVFSQYLLPLKFLERLTVEVMNWSTGKEIFMVNGDSRGEMREMSMNQFNNSASGKVFFGSIKACGEGISLVGASRIIILDVHLNPSVSRQAVGRAFRPGQTKKVHVYRLIAAESPEVELWKTTTPASERS